jgi:broad specificity phosphatase PhoE
VTTRRIFLARHGNRQDFVDPGWPSTADEPYDPPLSVDGVEQARRLGQRLAGEGIEAVVVSPFLRTIQTAHHANEAIGAPIYIEPGFGEWLNDRHFARLPRLRELTALRVDYPLLAVGGYVAAHSQRWPETVEQLRERSQLALEALLEKLGGTLLVVSHAAAVGAMALCDTEIDSVEVPLCALFCLEHDSTRWRLTLNSDVDHVGARLATFRFG